MDFKSTTEFFKKIRKGNFYEIDKLNYLEKITGNYDNEKTLALFSDLANYIAEISNKKELKLLLNPKKLTSEIKKLKEEGTKIPTRKIIVVNPPEGIPKEYDEDDLLAMFPDIEMNRLFSFQKELEELLEKRGAWSSAEETGNKNVQLRLRDFFYDIDNTTLDNIKKEYGNFKGKKLAIIIYLLDKRFNQITYSLNSKNMSRKRFAILFTDNPQIKMSGVDKYFDPKMELTFDTSSDSDFKFLEENLLKIIEKEVV